MIPLATTTISVLRRSGGSDDPYDEQPEPTAISTGTRAHISTGSGDENVEGGSQEVTEFRLNCDPTDLTFLDRVKDERTNEIFEVRWTRHRVDMPGLEYVQAGLKKVEGLVAS